jgi:branched-subunit amino acid aminotransferase/4-amino-4-deoxychorismate lyase
MSSTDGESSLARSPKQASFTTLPWDGGRKVRLPQLHMQRLRDHCQQLGITWPDDFTEQLERALQTLSPDDSGAQECNQLSQPAALLRVEVNDNGVVELAGRPCAETKRDVAGITHPAPRFDTTIQGMKHADWQSYYDSGLAARQANTDVALLIHDGAVIDGDRATPMLLDQDGVAWLSSPELGGVHSTTVEFLLDALDDAGIPLQYGRLTAPMLAQAREVVMVGSGVVAVNLVEVDGQPLANSSSILQPMFQTTIEKAGWVDFSNWIEVLRCA